MNKIETKNLFIEIRDKDFIILAGEYDEELNFKVLEKETVSSFGILNCKIIDLNKCVDDLKTGIQKIEKSAFKDEREWEDFFKANQWSVKY